MSKKAFSVTIINVAVAVIVIKFFTCLVFILPDVLMCTDVRLAVLT